MVTRVLFVGLLALIGVSASAQEHPALRWGMPDTGHVLTHDTFVLSYDGRLRSARWTAERLTRESLELGTGVDRQDRFRVDPRVPLEFRANDADYTNSTRNRGHLANSANHRGTQAANDDTFYFSVPQQNLWRSRREVRSRRLISEVTVGRVPASVAHAPAAAGYRAALLDPATP